MQIKNQIVISLVFSIVLSLLISGETVFASYHQNSVEAFDTIVGFDSLVKVQNTSPGQKFIFRILPPRGKEIFLQGVSFEGGIFRQEIPGSVLDEPGTYQVYILSSGQTVGNSQFSVYSDEPLSVGGDFGETSVLLSLADVAEPVGALEIRNLPLSVQANQTTSFSVRAIDADGNHNRDYRGTIHFTSPTDANALLPVDYTFQSSDLGEHTFQLSLSFRAEGVQRLVVEDTDMPEMRDETTITVTAPRSTSSSSTVRITSPTAGRYGVNVLQIEGIAPANATVDIYDNGQKIGVTRASSTGTFSYSSPVLSDGDHLLTVRSNSMESEEVLVTIDATASELTDFRLSKNPAGPGETITVTVKTDASLESVSVVLGDLLVDLTENPQIPGTYEGEITAPDQAGNYPIDVRTLDSNGNEGLYTEEETLVVDESVSSRVSFRVPSRVTNIRAVSGDHRVTLAWNPAQDDTGIVRYRIFYGIHPSNLNRVVNTADARTEWYIPDLQPGVEYFFTVAGVDTDGNEGQQKSEPVSVIVLGQVTGVSSASSISGFGNLANADRTGPPSSLPQDGPAVEFLFALSPLVALALRRRKK